MERALVNYIILLSFSNINHSVTSSKIISYSSPHSQPWLSEKQKTKKLPTLSFCPLGLQTAMYLNHYLISPDL